MENVIFTNAFEGYIEGTVVCPEKEVSLGILNLEFVQWRRLDRLILSWIYSTLTPEVMVQIVGYQTSHSAWVALEKLFSSSTRARLMQLRFEFQTTKKSSLSMMDYFLKLKTLFDNLAATGDPVSERDHILQILGGLGVGYNPIFASLMAREDDLPLQFMQSILLTQEQRLQVQETIFEGDLVTVNAATYSWRSQERKSQSRSFSQPSSRGRFHVKNQSSRSNSSRPHVNFVGSLAI